MPISLKLFLFFVLVCAFSSLRAQTESEPNNAFATADVLVLGDTVAGEFAESRDLDYYRIQVARAGVLNIRVFSVAADAIIRVILYGEDQTEIGRASAGAQAPVFYDQLVCAPGTYFVRVEHTRGRVSLDSYRLSVALDTRDVYECNNSFDTATPLALGESIQAQINSAGDLDYYRVNVTRPGVLVATLTNQAPNSRMRMFLYDADQGEIIAVISNQTGPLVINRLVCETGTYYLLLQDLNERGSDHLYSFIVSLDTTDVYECNNDFVSATPLDLGATIDAQINSAGDLDYFQVYVPRPGVLVGKITGVGASARMQVFLHRADQSLITRSFGNAAQPVTLNQLVCDTGTYYLVVEDWGDVASDNIYQFRVELDTSDVYEWNNDFETATPLALGSTIEAQINSAGDLDHYRVHVPRPGVLVGKVTSVDAAARIQIFLHAADQSQITRSFGNAAQSVTLNQLVCDTGTYYLIVEDWGDLASDDLYTFNVELDTSDVYECNNTFDDATPLTFGDTIRAQINSAGDLDYFRIEVPRAGVLRTYLEDVAATARMQVFFFNEDREQITRQFGNFQEPVFSNLLLCEPGSYYLVVEDWGDVASDNLYSFTALLDTTDVYECNNDRLTATSVVLCDSVVAAIGTAGDQDNYLLNLLEGDTITVTATPPGDGVRLAAAVFNTDGTRIATASATPAGGLDFFFLPTDAGDYYLTVASASGNDFTADPYVLHVTNGRCGPTSASNPRPVLNWSVSPNPVTEHLRLDLPEGLPSGGLEMKIYAMDGRQVYGRRVTATSSLHDLRALTAGMYTVQLSGRGGRYSRKILKR